MVARLCMLGGRFSEYIIREKKRRRVSPVERATIPPIPGPSPARGEGRVESHSLSRLKIDSGIEQMIVRMPHQNQGV